MSPSPTLLESTLAAQGEALVGYVRQRLGPAGAEDVVQDALVRERDALIDETRKRPAR